MIEIDIFKNKIKNLEKKDTILIVSDFDDTLFCRKEQLEKEKWLRENRWDKWNEYIMNEFWLDNLINKYYKNKKIPKQIIKQMQENKDLILTAWVKEIQEAKLKNTQLDKFNYIVVEKAEEKVMALIKYVVEELKIIPKEIIVYEDRPKVFIEWKNLIEETLWTKLRIMEVKMLSNNEEAIIEELFL